MATKEFFTNSDELKKLYSAARATITAPFFGNNVEEVKSVSEAYKLAKNSPGTVELTGMPIYKPEKIGLPQGANQLLFFFQLYSNIYSKNLLLLSILRKKENLMMLLGEN